jgi:hypothetical protein
VRILFFAKACAENIFSKFSQNSTIGNPRRINTYMIDDEYKIKPEYAKKVTVYLHPDVLKKLDDLSVMYHFNTNETIIESIYLFFKYIEFRERLLDEFMDFKHESPLRKTQPPNSDLPEQNRFKQFNRFCDQFLQKEFYKSAGIY